MAKSMKKSAMKAVKKAGGKKKSTMKKAMKKSAKKSSMKKRKAAKKPSIIAKGRGAKARVFRGSKTKTSGGLKKSDLVKNKRGKVVSKKASQRSKNSKGGKVISKWGAAVKASRKQLGIKGFCPVGGKTAKGQQLLKAVRSIVGKK